MKSLVIKAAVMIYWTFVYGAALTAGLVGSMYMAFTAFQRYRKEGRKKMKLRELPPPCMTEPAHGEHHYVQIKNVKLHYVSKGDKSKPLMLFVHGFPDFWFTWRKQMDYFSKNYWTVAYDMRGYGESEKPPDLLSYKMKHLVEDMKNLIIALGREKCTLVAHDWGGLVAWFFLYEYPNMVDSYIMIGMFPIYYSSFRLKQLLKSYYIFVFQWPIIAERFFRMNDMAILNKFYATAEPEEIEAYKFYFGKPGGFTYGILYYRANLSAFIRKKNPGFAPLDFPPGLLIYTDNDPFLDVSNFPEAKDKVVGLELAFIEKGTHFIHVTKPDETNKCMEEYLADKREKIHDTTK